jgi:tetratricopeptide (TPR) repeat protein
MREAAIRDHLSQLLASRWFSSSRRLSSFLTFVVDKTLSGQSEAIKEYVIATEVYGRSSGYDPQIDSTVRVEASRLRAKLRDYYASEGANSPVRIDLPKGSYVPIFTTPTAPNGRYSRFHIAGTVCAILLFVLLLTLKSESGRSATPPSSAVSEDTVLLEKYLRADRLLRRPALENGWSGDPPPSLHQSIALFEDITRQSPKYAKAWIGLAEVQEWAYELDKRHPRERLEAARQAAERAVALNPNMAEAHSRLSAIYFYSYGDLKRAEQESIRAIELNPRDVRVQARYADLLRIQGRLSDALATTNRALAVEPASARLWSQQALVLYDLDRIPEAIASADHALGLNPGNQMNQLAIAYWVRGLCLQQQGILDRAEAEFRKGLAVAPQDDRNQPSLGFVLAQQGRTAQAREVLAALTQQHARGKPVSYGIALLHTALGHTAEANRWLARSAAMGETSYRFLALDKRLQTAANRANAVAFQTTLQPQAKMKPITLASRLSRPLR